MEIQKQDDPTFLHQAHSILDITARRFFQPWIQPQPLFWLSKYHKIYKDSVYQLNKLLQEVFYLI